MKPCPACRGKGKIVTYHGASQEPRESVCPACGGTGNRP